MYVNLVLTLGQSVFNLLLELSRDDAWFRMCCDHIVSRLVGSRESNILMCFSLRTTKSQPKFKFKFQLTVIADDEINCEALKSLLCQRDWNPSFNVELKREHE